MFISSWVHINDKKAIVNGEYLLPEEEYVQINEPQDLYRKLSLSYMKFFKMDLLCKWAWLGAETLLVKDGNEIYDNTDKNKVAVVMMTSYGCIDVDKKYEASRADIPSPALFVYTLPNIMLGEICIRHGFKGEQMSLVSDNFDVDEIYFWVNDLLTNKGMEACVCGWADAYDDTKDICLFLVTKKESDISFTKENLLALYNK